MEPTIESTAFGSITIDGATYGHDVVIRPSGKVRKRKKNLSKAVYGSSHTVSRAEAEFVYRDGMERLIVGTGQTGLLHLSEDATQFLQDKGCAVDLLPTPKAIGAWNKARGRVGGLFHVTC